ncbi:hypothetical protein, partial [Escherichia coli]|uniref:hypothetical protein n=1 Tax=Escherichia coli TaxID=562 RepID=UPI001BB1EAD8
FIISVLVTAQNSRVKNEQGFYPDRPAGRVECGIYIIDFKEIIIIIMNGKKQKLCRAVAL